MLIWKWEISLLIMREMYGNERASICLGLTNFGTNMRWWRRCLAIRKKSARFSKTGWHGNQLRMLGMLTSSSKKDLDRLIIADLYLRGTSSWILILRVTSKLPSLKNTIGIEIERDWFMKDLLLSWVRWHSLKTCLSSLQDSRYAINNILVQKYYSSMLWKTCPKTTLSACMNNSSNSRSNMVPVKIWNKPWLQSVETF